MTLTTLVMIIFSIISYASIFEDLKQIEKKLELEHYKLNNKGNLYKYLLPIIPSLIPVLNIITAFTLAEAKDNFYEDIRKYKCLLIMDNKLEKIYNTLDNNQKSEFEYDLGRANYAINIDGKEKSKIFNVLAEKYEKDIIYYEFNKETNTLSEVDDNYLDDNEEIIKEKAKVKKLVI